MTFTKKLMITGVLVSTLAATGTFAYGPHNDGQRGPKMDPAQRFEYIFNQLEFTDEQRANVLQIMATLREEHRADMKEKKAALREQQKRPTREEMQAMMAAEHDIRVTELTDQLNTVLTADDTAELIEYLEFHRHSMEGRGPKGPKPSCSADANAESAE